MQIRIILPFIQIYYVRSNATNTFALLGIFGNCAFSIVVGYISTTTSTPTKGGGGGGEVLVVSSP